MVVVYVGSFPYDPELELKNFQRKQTEYEAAYHHTRDPLVLFEALLNASAYLQFPAELNWLVKAVGNNIRKSKTNKRGRPDKTVERFQDRMRHVRRYRCVRDLCQKGHAEDSALDLAVATLAAASEAAARPTISDSYHKVRKSLEREKHESEYFLLVARSDPTVVPVLRTQGASGATINGVTISPAVKPTSRGR